MAGLNHVPNELITARDVAEGRSRVFPKTLTEMGMCIRDVHFSLRPVVHVACSATLTGSAAQPAVPQPQASAQRHSFRHSFQPQLSVPQLSASHSFERPTALSVPQL